MSEHIFFLVASRPILYFVSSGDYYSEHIYGAAEEEGSVEKCNDPISAEVVSLQYLFKLEIPSIEFLSSSNRIQM